MTTLQSMPIIAYGGCILVILATAAGVSASKRAQWALPAVIGALFLVFSLVTVLTDGLLMFWVNHTTNLTGNQVWFDLVMAIAIGFYLLAPRARAVGMPLMPWAIAVVLTACIALLPMLARVLWLEQQVSTRPVAAGST